MPSTFKQSGVMWEQRRDIGITILIWTAIAIFGFWLLGHVGSTILLFIIASFFAYALYPVVTFLEAYIPRFFAILIVYLIVFALISILIFMVVSTAVMQITVLTHDVSSILTVKSHTSSSPLIQTLERFGISYSQIQQAGQQLVGQIGQLTSSIIPLLSSIVTSIVDILLVAVMSIYLLIDGKKFMIWSTKYIPDTQKGNISFITNALKKVLGGYIRGQLAMSSLIGILVGTGMSVLHVPYAVLLGVLAFVLEFIPILGTLTSGLICVLLALTQGWVLSLVVLGYFILVHIIEGDIVGPKILGQALGLHPLVSMLALIAGSELFGIVGALFASPVAGILQVFFLAFLDESTSTGTEATET